MFVCLFHLSRLKAARPCTCVADELPFSTCTWSCLGESQDSQVFLAPAGLLLTWGKEVCRTYLAPGGNAGHLLREFRISNPQLGACEPITKCLRHPNSAPHWPSQRVSQPKPASLYCCKYVSSDRVLILTSKTLPEIHKFYM